jgi:hypothetical protein
MKNVFGSGAAIALLWASVGAPAVAAPVPEAQHNLQTTARSQRHFSLVKCSSWAQSQSNGAVDLANADLIDGLQLRIGREPLSCATPD